LALDYTVAPAKQRLAIQQDEDVWLKYELTLEAEGLNTYLRASRNWGPLPLPLGFCLVICQTRSSSA